MQRRGRCLRLPGILQPACSDRAKPQELRPKCQSPRLGTRRPRRRRRLLSRRGLRTAMRRPRPRHAGRQADDNVQYEFKSVQALRGRESSAKAKWQDQGWEFVSENRATLRTELNFRRVKPKTVGAYLLSFVATFRRLQPKTQSVLVASCALILVAGIIGIVLGTQSGGDTPNPSAAQTAASTAPPAEPSEADASQSSGPHDEQVLTADNSREFAALLALPDYCDETSHDSRPITAAGPSSSMVPSRTWPITATTTLDTTSSSPPGTRVPNLRLGRLQVRRCERL